PHQRQVRTHVQHPGHTLGAADVPEGLAELSHGRKCGAAGVKAGSACAPGMRARWCGRASATARGHGRRTRKWIIPPHADIAPTTAGTVRCGRGTHGNDEAAFATKPGCSRSFPPWGVRMARPFRDTTEDAMPS